MRRLIYLFLLAIFYFLISACNRDEVPRVPRIPPDGSILAFGDSLTFGSGAKPEQSYPNVLASLSGRNVIRSGVPGEVSNAGLRRLPEELATHQPDLLIICHGGNDILRRVNLQTTANNIREMIRLAQAESISVVLIGVPKLELVFSLKSAEFYGQIASEFKIPYLDETLPELEGNRKYKSDNIHLNALGYQKLAEEIFTLLKKSGAL